MTYNREVYVAQMRAYIGAEMGNSKHKHIVDMYNTYKPHPRGHALTYTDDWCAGTVSAASVECGYTKIIPIECSCTEQIKLFRALGSYEDDDNYVPTPGDLIYYNWKGQTAPTDKANHVGVVEFCDGKNITVIEGNMNNKCQRRTIKVGWKYIHGFAVPKYNSTTTYYVVKRGDSLSKIAVKYGYKSFKDLLPLNPDIKDPNKIYVGQKVRVK